MSPEQVLYALMYEVKTTSKSPPSTTAIDASNRKDWLYQAYRAVLSVPSVLRVPRLYRVDRVTEKGGFSPQMIWLVTYVVLILFIIIVFVLKTK